MERLIHFSAIPLAALRSVRQPGPAPFKPNGLWVSVEGREDGWLAYSLSDYWRPERFIHQTEITLHLDANVIRIQDADGLDAFTERFCRAGGSCAHTDQIDWRAVAASFDGIIISPYIWQRRLTLLWYYGWDCASGCIWNMRAVERATPTSLPIPTR